MRWQNIREEATKIEKERKRNPAQSPAALQGVPSQAGRIVAAHPQRTFF
jgi:hypothetical protein